MRTIKFLLITLAFVASTSSFAAEVSRAVFTTSVDNHEPVLNVDSINSNSYNSISFFTELNQLSGHNITHQWMYNDQVMFEKTFEVRGDRWRVWTSKTLIPNWTGSWTVNVLDDDRSVLSTKSFDYH